MPLVVYKLSENVRLDNSAVSLIKPRIFYRRVVSSNMHIPVRSGRAQLDVACVHQCIPIRFHGIRDFGDRVGFVVVIVRSRCFAFSTPGGFPQQGLQCRHTTADDRNIDLNNAVHHVSFPYNYEPRMSTYSHIRLLDENHVLSVPPSVLTTSIWRTIVVAMTLVNQVSRLRYVIS